MEKNAHLIEREQIPSRCIQSNLSGDPVAKDRDFNAFTAMQLIAI